MRPPAVYDPSDPCNLIKERITQKLRLPRNMFYGWWIAIVSASVDSLKHGTFNKGFTSYIIPLRNELGISLAAISFAEMLGASM